MISVIVPVYNCKDYLMRCVDSIKAQSYDDLQIILVDDGSTDGSGLLCDQAAADDSRILVLHKLNGGVSSARNAGLDAASGDYITFADSDDYLHIDHIKNLYELLKKNNADAAFCSFVTEYDGSLNKSIDTAELHNKEYVYDHDSAVCELLAGGAVGGYVWNKLYRSDLLKNIRFDVNIKLLEDLLFNYHVFKRINKAVFSDCKSYRYIQRGQSAMHKGFCDEHRMMVSVAESICSDLQGSNKATENAGKGLLATTILWVVDVMAEYGPYDKKAVETYKAEFKPLRKTYMKLKRVPFSYRMSAVFFSMGYGVFKLSVKTVRMLRGEKR